MALVNCLNMTCQNVARMTMLEKGTCLQWRPLVYSDLPTQVKKRPLFEFDDFLIFRRVYNVQPG